MSHRFSIRHETLYQYAEPVALSHSEARLMPREMPWQILDRQSITLAPTPGDRRERTDAFGNSVLYFAAHEPHDRAVALSEFTVDLLPEHRPDPATSGTAWTKVPANLRNLPSAEYAALYPYMIPSARVPANQEIAAYGREAFAGEDLVEGCQRLMAAIFRDFTFDPSSTTVTTRVEEAFADKRGVCQDFSHVMICALRSLGLPARYVSGYIETVPPPGKEKLAGADATHAWVSVYDPACGWLDFDPTNNLSPSTQHITIGWGRDFDDIIPLKGVVSGGGSQQLSVSVDVRRISH